MSRKGDVLVTNTSIVNGELIETEGEAFIREKLRPAAGDLQTDYSDLIDN